MESHGGSWGSEERLVYKHIARTAARLTGDQPNDILEQYFQRFSVSLHCANVRAILRRAPAPPPATTAIAAAHSALARAEAQRSAGPMCLDPS